MVDPYIGLGQRRDFSPGNEGTTTGSDRAKLGHGFAVTGDDENLTRGYRFDHFGVLIAQFALGDYAHHNTTVANYAT